MILILYEFTMQHVSCTWPILCAVMEFFHLLQAEGSCKTWAVCSSHPCPQGPQRYCSACRPRPVEPGWTLHTSALKFQKPLWVLTGRPDARSPCHTHCVSSHLQWGIPQAHCWMQTVKQRNEQKKSATSARLHALQHCLWGTMPFEKLNKNKNLRTN